MKQNIIVDDDLVIILVVKVRAVVIRITVGTTRVVTISWC